MEKAIEVTIAGESVDYTMSFTAPADGQYQITLDGVPNVGDTYLTNWNRNRSNYSSIYVSDGTQTWGRFKMVMFMICVYLPPIHLTDRP